MKQSRNENTPSSKTAWLAILLAMAASASTASAMPKKYFIAGVYPTRSEMARTVSKIDLDQTEINRLLALDLQNNKDSNWLQKARQVYENGMHSGSYASLTITKGLDHKVDLPDPVESFYEIGFTHEADPNHHNVYLLKVFGMNEDYDKQVEGIVKTTSDSLNSNLHVIYPEDSKCMVQGETSECFAKKGGITIQGYGALDYTYNPNTDNKYSSSLMSFQEAEGTRMYYCEHNGGCRGYLEYQTYFDFYGTLDYGHHWIESAFLNQKTDFPKDFKTENGYEDVDFSKFADLSRNNAISTSTVAMNVFMQINRLMVEFGVDGCNKSTKDFSSYGDHLSMDSVVASWDQAAALYAGSALIAPEGVAITTTGSLYFSMVQTHAKAFGAMEFDHETYQLVSIVNRNVMEAFKNGRVALSQSDCDGGVRDSYYIILNAMRVPWIQGVLAATFEYSNYRFDTLQDREEQRGKAAVYMAALLPDLHKCSPKAAETVMEELAVMWPHKGFSEKLRPDFKKVRTALEHQYQCLAVTCDEIGGLVDHRTSAYYEETRPCGGYGTMLAQRRESVAYSDSWLPSSPSKSSSSFVGNHKSGLAMSSFLVALALFGVTLSVLVAMVRDRSRGNAATRLVSGAVSQADHWLSRRTSNESSYSRVDTDYEVQLRPMSLQAPLQPGDESLIL